MNTGKMIRTARQKAGISSHELGRRLGISHQAVLAYEKQKFGFAKVDTLLAIAKALNLKLVMELSPKGKA